MKIFLLQVAGFLVSTLIILSWAIIICLIIPVVTLYLMHYIFPDLPLITNLIVKIPDLRFIFGIIIIISSLGMVISRMARAISFIYIWKLKMEEIIIYIFMSLIFAYFFWNSFSITLKAGYFGFIILFIFFIMYMPNFINYISYGVEWLRTFIFGRNQTIINIHSLIFKIILVVTIIGMGAVFASYSLTFIQKQQDKRGLILARKSIDPMVDKIEPYIVYHSSWIIIYGSNFGFKNQGARLLSDQGEVATSLWTNSKLVFNIPLHWETGIIHLWIARPAYWRGKKIITRSNIVKINLISRINGWDKDDDNYFYQLSKLGNESLYLNGYEK